VYLKAENSAITKELIIIIMQAHLHVTVWACVGKKDID